jgi:hypothetical protein
MKGKRIPELILWGTPKKWTLSGVFILLQGLLTGAISFAQEADTAAVDSVGGINKTTKGVFTELKDIAKTNESTWTSLFMILMVIVLVGIALWLSFKSSSTDDKRKKVLDRQRKRTS